MFIRFRFLFKYIFIWIRLEKKKKEKKKKKKTEEIWPSDKRTNGSDWRVQSTRKEVRVSSWSREHVGPACVSFFQAVSDPSLLIMRTTGFIL